MPSNRADISTAIVNLLKTVSGLHNEVYDYHPAEFTRFPNAVVQGAGHDEKIADNGRDLRLYHFDIIVYLDRSKDGSIGGQNAETARRTLEDSILSVLDQNQTLSGTSLWCRAQTGGWNTADSLLYFIFNLTAYQSVNIS